MNSAIRPKFGVFGIEGGRENKPKQRREFSSICQVAPEESFRVAALPAKVGDEAIAFLQNHHLTGRLVTDCFEGIQFTIEVLVQVQGAIAFGDTLAEVLSIVGEVGIIVAGKEFEGGGIGIVPE